MIEMKTANITCPECGHTQKIGIPESSCLAFYECGNCKKTVQAKKTCCVICDYSDEKCPVSHDATKEPL
jgi:hypothetical protein